MIRERPESHASSLHVIQEFRRSVGRRLIIPFDIKQMIDAQRHLSKQTPAFARFHGQQAPNLRAKRIGNTVRFASGGGGPESRGEFVEPIAIRIAIPVAIIAIGVRTEFPESVGGITVSIGCERKDFIGLINCTVAIIIHPCITGASIGTKW